jgi:hypothetical protein
MGKTFSVPEGLFRPDRDGEATTPPTVAQLKAAEKKLGVKLPAAYVAVLKVRNGGRLLLTEFKMKAKPPKASTWSRSQTYSVPELPGVDPRRSESLVDLYQTGKECGVNAGLDPFNGGGHHWLCLDYRKCGARGEPTITHWEQGNPFQSAGTPKPVTYHVADSFAELIRGLRRAADVYEPATIALDGASVRGERLAKLLKSLGCKKHKFVGVRSSRPLPPTWEWPKFKNFVAGLTCWLSLEKNRTYGYAPKFGERPKGHPMLRVSVTPRQAEHCLAELMATLGADAKLLRGVV